MSMHLTKADEQNQDGVEVLTPQDVMNAVQIGSLYPMKDWAKQSLRNAKKVLRGICVTACPPDEMYRLMRAMVHRAIQGDTKAAALVMERTLGKAAEEPDPDEMVDANKIDPRLLTAEEVEVLATIKRKALNRKKLVESGEDAAKQLMNEDEDDSD